MAEGSQAARETGKQVSGGEPRHTLPLRSHMRQDRGDSATWPLMDLIDGADALTSGEVASSVRDYWPGGAPDDLEGPMTDEPTYAVHVRNGAVPTAILVAAFADLGLTAVTIEDVPGEGQLIQMHTAVAALLAHLAQAHGKTPAVALQRLAETL